MVVCDGIQPQRKQTENADFCVSYQVCINAEDTAVYVVHSKKLTKIICSCFGSSYFLRSISDFLRSISDFH